MGRHVLGLRTFIRVTAGPGDRSFDPPTPVCFVAGAFWNRIGERGRARAILDGAFASYLDRSVWPAPGICAGGRFDLTFSGNRRGCMVALPAVPAR